MSVVSHFGDCNTGLQCATGPAGDARPIGICTSWKKWPMGPAGDTGPIGQQKKFEILDL